MMDWNSGITIYWVKDQCACTSHRLTIVYLVQGTYIYGAKFILVLYPV